MAGKAKGLGRGLGALLGSEVVPAADTRAVIEISIHDISPNRDQPRKNFDEKKLEELASSIRENGVIQPLIVTHQDGGYRIVAGERRWRAARLAGLDTVPVIVRELSDAEILQQALIENIQRQDLNPIETAEALERLQAQYQMTQEKLSTSVGMSRPALANTLRLLQLGEKLQNHVRDGVLSQGHARALLALPDEEARERCADYIIEKELSVRNTEKLVRRLLKEPQTRPAAADDSAVQQRRLEIARVEERLARALGTRVNLSDRGGRGRIVVEYYSLEDLDRILEIVEQTGCEK
ncbi:MAG: ParB/RepB/Spo0J family partition protein [Bacillota bacterium]|nr:ParB/RepB/Spo0J family partition protein [Bacillota bacterium]